MSANTSNHIPANVVLVPDTNIFIEAKDLKDLPWEELASQEVRLMACPTVLEEIDDLKTSVKNRVKERARKWNSNFKKLLSPGALPLVLKERFPRVTLEILKANSVGPSQGLLDLTKKDKQVVDWTLRYRDANQSEDVRLLTEDTGPLGKAYELNLAVLPMPEHWRPELGPSEDQKEIETLRQKIKLYQDNYPKPVIRILDGQRKDLTGIKLKARPYRNLTSDEVDALIDELKQNDPPVTAEQLKSPDGSQLHLSGGLLWKPPTDETISKYLHEEYPAWIAETKRVLFELGTNLSIGSLIAGVTVALTNQGARPAESVKLTVKASGYIALLKNKIQPASLFTPPVIPNSPRPPIGEFVNPALDALSWASAAYAAQFRNWNNLGSPDVDSLTRLPIFGRPQRDKNAWYLDEEEGPSSYTAEKIFTCDEWRHHEGSIRKNLLVQV
jgi:PIN domain